ncbi:hypothetical protein FQY83_11390 [Luteimonas marina]|uniref:HEPN domain-containing protein n=1 Tax=Luteimonas marina TaxID=488485 RepID=A0A5C5U322_9GAMM|nr:hypothetical protein [Luteimonas marina]TWT20326.1 hypothetical protein FQY83_11390 [Luteimonas marina]
MELVAVHLQTEAVSRSSGEEKDLFGRSSYNRYYYATFLCVRGLLRRLNAEWADLPHAAYPELLRGKVKKALQKGRASAQKTGDADVVRACNRACSAVLSLAKLMTESSATRVTADYYPEVPIQFSGVDRFSLRSVDITTAHSWLTEAQTYTMAIEEAWNQINA